MMIGLEHKILVAILVVFVAMVFSMFAFIYKCEQVELLQNQIDSLQIELQLEKGYLNGEY